MKHDLVENISKIYYNGSIWKTNNFGELKIIGKVNKKYKNKFIYYLCEFIETKTIVVAQTSHIKHGNIKDVFKKHVLGVGFLGSEEGVICKKTYKKWNEMLKRCYSEEYHKINPCYKDVTVDPRWHNFKNFCEDITSLRGYSNWKNDTNKINLWQLDKDILCDKMGISPKVYGKNTCMFVTQKENITHSQLTGITYVATRELDGHYEEFVNISEFARKYELSQGDIWMCINNKRPRHKGWVFTKKEEL